MLVKDQRTTYSLGLAVLMRIVVMSKIHVHDGKRTLRLADFKAFEQLTVGGVVQHVAPITAGY